MFWVMNGAWVLLILANGIPLGITAVYVAIDGAGTQRSDLVECTALVLGAVAITVLHLVMLVAVNVVVRVWFEIALLLFNMYDSLKDLQRRLPGLAPPAEREPIPWTPAGSQ